MRKESFAKNLKEIREFLGYKQNELAKKAGLTQAAICNLEAGTRLPSITSIVNLSNALGVTLDRLVFGKEPI